MPAGRPPKPTALKVLQGNPGRRPLNLKEPRPAAALEKPPAWLDADGRKVWRDLAPRFIEMGVLTIVDMEAFAHACAKLATARREQGGFSKALDQAERILARFGWTPSDRAKITVEPKSEDPFEEFLAKKAK